MLYFYEVLVCNNEFLVPGSSRVEDALGDTIPPASHVLCSLFNLVPADAHFLEIFLDDIFPVLSRSTWPPPEKKHLRACRGSLWWYIRERCPSHPSQTSASDNVFQLWKCSCLSDFLICYFVLPGCSSRKSQDTSLPSVVCCFEFFFICVTETGHSSALVSNVERTSAS